MQVTAKDVARELNLSQPTVSRILNGDEGHRASDITRQRVIETAQRLGYQPNAIARSLRRGRTDIIGVHTNHNYDVRNDFFGTIVGSLQVACTSYHLDLMVHSARHGSSTDAIFAKLRDGRIDGLILHASADDPLVEMVAKSSLPVVVVADPLPGLPSVTCDDASGMRQLVGMLWDRGYRKYVFLAPGVPLASIEARQQTFVDELTKRGLAAADREVKDVDFERSQDALDELLDAAAGKKMAVCCWNDRTAYNLLRECGQQNVSVPGQLAVAGFDGFRDEKLPARQLVTVRCPWEDVASKALEILVQLIEHRGVLDHRNHFAQQDIRLPVAVLDGDTI